MKITFDDKSFVEIRKTDEGKILVIIQAMEIPSKKITNAVELTKEEYQALISDIKDL